MNATDCCSQIATTNISYKILIKDSDSYELVFEKDLTEDRIIKNVIEMTSCIICSTDEIIIRLKYLYACIEFGNCVQVMAQLPKIVDTLLHLWQRPFFNKVSSTVLQLLEKIVLNNKMTTSWNPLLVTKILKIPLCGFPYNNKPQARLIATVLSNIADVLPIEKTIDIIRGHLVTDYINLRDWHRLLWSLKLLCYLAMQRGDEVTPRHVRKVREALVALTRDNCELVSSNSVFTLVALYENTDICPEKDRIQEELMKLIPHGMYIFRDFYKAMLSDYYEPEPEASISELPENSVRTESEIIKIACDIQPTTPIEERKQALMDFCECITHGNCEMATKNFRKICLMLMKLLHWVDTSMDLIMVLDVIEKIFRCKQMKPYWTVYYREILLKIILLYDISTEEFIDAIDRFIRNIADTLPVTETIKILDTLIATAGYPYALCSMKILWEVAGQHKLFSKANLEQLLATVVYTIDDPLKNLRLLAECVLFKLSAKLGEQRIMSVIETNQTMDRRFRIILNRTCKFSA